MFKFNFTIEEDSDNQNKKFDENEQLGALNQDFGYICIDDLPSMIRSEKNTLVFIVFTDFL